jgi:RNA polymerase sigma-70 factor, ECF subfamily
MDPSDKSRITQWVTQANDADRAKGVDQFMPEVYEELRQLAHHYFQNERSGDSLQPTALVHEAYLRLVDQSRINVQGRTHFFALCAKVMRQILIDHARRRQRVRHGGGRKKVKIHSGIAEAGLDMVDLVALNDSIEELARFDAREARVVEMKYFGGLDVTEIAVALGVSKRTIEGDWKHARTWLQIKLGEGTAA